MTESDLVAKWRALRFTWPQIAQNLGKSIDYVRSNYDQAYMHTPKAPPPALEPPPEAVRGMVPRWDGERVNTFVRALYAASEPVGREAFKFHPGVVVHYLRRKYGSHVLRTHVRCGWSLTESGRVMAREVFGLK